MTDVVEEIAGAERARVLAREWIEENWDPQLTILQWLERLADSGWAKPTWARGSFGLGLTNDEAAAAAEEFRKIGAPGPQGGLSMLAAPTIVAHGSEEQQKRFVRAILTNQETWCQLFSEPGAGSDLASLQTRAMRDGDEWIVNGQKVWTSGGQFADLGMLIARTNPDAPKHKGISWFAFEMRQPGVEVRPLRQMTGGASFCEVFFTDARVPHENLVGGENEGWAATLTTLANERVNLGAGGAGGFATTAPAGRRQADALKAPVGEFVERARARRAEGGRRGGRGGGRAGGRGGGRGGRGDMMVGLAKSLGRNHDPVLRQQIAQLYTLQNVNRWNGMRAKAAVASGQRPGPENSLGKLMTSHIVRASRDVGMAIVQAGGMLSGADAPINGGITSQFLSSPAPSIYGGSDQVQRNIIGERVLGLPKEPDPYADVPFRELKVGTQRSEG